MSDLSPQSGAKPDIDRVCDFMRTRSVLENPHFDPAGFHVGHAKMILGLLCKSKKKRALAVQHLSEAKRVLSRFGQTPALARVDMALAELKQ
jgi:hypothetical protein